jgi:hypothetical protein
VKQTFLFSQLSFVVFSNTSCNKSCEVVLQKYINLLTWTSPPCFSSVLLGFGAKFQFNLEIKLYLPKTLLFFAWFLVQILLHHLNWPQLCLILLPIEPVPGMVGAGLSFGGQLTQLVLNLDRSSGIVSEAANNK